MENRKPYIAIERELYSNRKLDRKGKMAFRRMLIKLSPVDALQTFVRHNDKMGLQVLSADKNVDVQVRRNAYMERGMRKQTENLIPVDDEPEPVIPEKLMKYMASALRVGRVKSCHSIQNYGEMGPWQENAVKQLEEGF